MIDHAIGPGARLRASTSAAGAAGPAAGRARPGRARDRAQAFLLGGRVQLGLGDAARFDRKPGELVDAGLGAGGRGPPAVHLAERREDGDDARCVRGGPRRAVCLDDGASTGGFTDVPPPARGGARPRGRRRAGPARDRARPQISGWWSTTGERALPRGRRARRTGLARGDRRLLHLARARARAGGACLAPGGRIVALVKPSRGRAWRGAGRGRARSGCPPGRAGARAGDRSEPDWSRSTSSVPRCWGRQATASSSSTSVCPAARHRTGPSEERPDLPARVAECTAA